MQLITGGMGFIGLHNARALLDMGEACVITRHHVSRVPDFIREELGMRVFIEYLDVSDRTELLESGRRHPITGLQVSIDGFERLVERSDHCLARRFWITGFDGIQNALMAFQGYVDMFGEAQHDFAHVCLRHDQGVQHLDQEWIGAHVNNFLRNAICAMMSLGV